MYSTILLVTCFYICISTLFSTPTIKAHLLPQQNILLSSPNTTIQIVEHIVLFDIKQFTNPSKYANLREELKGLATIKGVLTLSAGDVYPINPSSVRFDLFLHARFRNKIDLKNYLEDPKHVNLLGELLNPIAAGVLLFDWESNLEGPLVPPPGTAVRLNLLKLKESFLESQTKEVLDVIGSMKDKYGTMLEHSYGENFNPKDAYGYTIACAAMFPRLEDLEYLDATGDMSKLMEPVRDLIETTVEVDYIY